MTPPGVTLFCDPPVAALMRQLGGQAGYPVAVLSAPAPLMLAQILRHTRNDVLLTLAAAMDQAVQQGLVLAASRVDGFKNTLVLAAKQSWHGNIAAARLAVTDATTASGLDGRAVLSANGIAAASVQGAANTADVAFLLATGAADVGLVYLTDVKADARLRVVATLEADPGLVTYALAVNAKAVSPNAQNFVDFLQRQKSALREGGFAPA